MCRHSDGLGRKCKSVPLSVHCCGYCISLIIMIGYLPFSLLLRSGEAGNIRGG